MNMSGVLAVESSYISFRSNDPVDMKLWPRCSSTNCLMEVIRASGRRILIRISLWNPVNFSQAKIVP